MNEPELIETILREANTIAVVGLSGRRYRPSHTVAELLQASGYRIIPVNPEEYEILGEKCYPRLEDVPEAIDLVNVFRRPEYVPAIVESAIRIGAKWIWLQEHVVHEDAAARAEAAGLGVVMDRCILKEQRRLRLFR